MRSEPTDQPVLSSQDVRRQVEYVVTEMRRSLRNAAPLGSGHDQWVFQGEGKDILRWVAEVERLQQETRQLAAWIASLATDPAKVWALMLRGDIVTPVAWQWEREQRQIAEAALSALQAERQASCAWSLADEDTGHWVGTCGADWCLGDGTPADNGMKFCPTCGRTLTEIASSSDQETPK